MFNRLSYLARVAVVGTIAACGGGPDVSVSPPSKTIAGLSATAYPVANGAVRAYRLNNIGQRGPAIGTTTTDANGAFQLQLTESTSAPLLIAVSSGSYVEPATGTPVSLAGSELTALAPSRVRVAGDVLTGLVISPVSHLVA